jgi:hypothetical protein
MSKAVSDRARFDAAFHEFAQIIRQEEHNDASIFRMISEMIPYQPMVATAFAANVARLLDEEQGEVDYVQVVIEAWGLTLFSSEQDRDAGYPFVDAFQGDPAKAEELVRLSRAHDDLGATSIITTASFQLH